MGLAFINQLISHFPYSRIKSSRTLSEYSKLYEQQSYSFLLHFKDIIMKLISLWGYAHICFLNER